MDVDVAASRLKQWGAQALAMPRRAFDVEGHTHPLITSSGARIGRLVPGRGIALDADLKALGITRPVPGVLERTPWRRLLDALAGDRGAITSMATLRSATRRVIYAVADSFPSSVDVGSVLNQFDCLDRQGTFNSAGTVAPTRTSLAGAYNAALNDPPAGKTKYLLGVSAMAATTNFAGFDMGVYVDVLSSFGNVDATITTIQTINSAALTRYTTGAGVYLHMASPWNGTFNVTYSSLPTYTVVYTNQAGTGSRSTSITSGGDVSQSRSIAHDGGSSSVNDDLFMFPLVAGDYGMRSVQSFTASVASSAVGATVGGFLYKPLFFMHALTELGTTVERDMRAEPDALVGFAVDGSNVLGYHTMLWRTHITTANGSMIFTFDTCEA